MFLVFRAVGRPMYELCDYPLPQYNNHKERGNSRNTTQNETLGDGTLLGTLMEQEEFGLMPEHTRQELTKWKRRSRA